MQPKTTVGPVVPTVYERTMTEFVTTFSLSGESLKRSAKLLVSLVELNERAFVDIIERCPTITTGVLECLHRCGKCGMDPVMMIQNAPAVRPLLALPAEQAREVLRDGVDVVRESPNGKPSAVQKVPVEKLTRADAMTAFDNGRIRTQAEQKKMIDARKAAKSKPWPAYQFDDNGRVRFLDHRWFNADHVVKIGEEAAQKAREALAKISTKAKA